MNYKIVLYVGLLLIVAYVLHGDAIKKAVDNI